MDIEGDAAHTEPRNLVVCMDGTGNAPKASGNTNVLRLFGMLDHSDPSKQIAFYTPGVGTRGDPAALTAPAKVFTKIRGMISGYGIRRDIADAYTFLVDNYRPGDKVYIFGFSRGAFAALALAGTCRLFGLVRQSSVNMVGHVIQAITKPLRKSADIGAYKFRQRFSQRLELSKEPRRWWTMPIHFVGLFDVVKALKYFKFIIRLKEGWLKKWYHPAFPFTRNPEEIAILRHAVSLDDRRLPYDVFRLEPASSVDFEEVWFAGVHTDVGGGFDDEEGRDLGRITLKWMLESAIAAGLILKAGEYEDKCAVTEASAGAKIHRNSAAWYLVGWRRRIFRRRTRQRILERPFWKWFEPLPAERIEVHSSVKARKGYRLPEKFEVTAVDPDWTLAKPGGFAHRPLRPE